MADPEGVAAAAAAAVDAGPAGVAADGIGVPGGVLGGNPGLQPKMVTDGVADIALVIPAYSAGRFPLVPGDSEEFIPLPDDRPGTKMRSGGSGAHRA